MHCQRVILICVSVFLLGCASRTALADYPKDAGGTTGPVCKVYTAFRFDVRFREERMWRSPKVWEHSFDTSPHGSGILVEDKDGQCLFVTAAHVVDPGAKETIAELQMDDGVRIKIDGNNAELLRVERSVRVSNLSIKPTHVLVSRDLDVAVFVIDENDLPLIVVPRFKKFGEAKAGGRVLSWGFPGSSSPQLKDNMRITEAGATILTLNSPLEPGYSGGPVVDEQGALVGLVVRSTEKQSRCVSIQAIQPLLRDAKARATPYRDGQ